MRTRSRLSLVTLVTLLGCAAAAAPLAAQTLAEATTAPRLARRASLPPTPAPALAPCDEARVAQTMDAPAEAGWVTGCAELSDGATVLAALWPAPAQSTRGTVLAVRLERGGHTRWQQREELRGNAFADVRALLEQREQWRLRVLEVQGPGGRGVRVALDGQVGEDYARVDELALVYRFAQGDAALRRVWVGRASRSFNAMDVCTTGRVVEMRFADARTLELRAQSYRFLGDGAELEASLVRELRHDCAQERTYVHRFTVQ